MTNFFEMLNGINFNGTLNLAISPTDENQMVVSVLLRNDSCGDNAKNHIPPLTLKGSVEDLDNGFFQAIGQPIEQTSTLLHNMEAYQKGVEDAKANALIEKDKKDKAEAEKKANEKFLKDTLDKVEAFEKEGEFDKAYTFLIREIPDPNKFLDRASYIKDKIKCLLNKKSTLNLFENQ